VDYFTVPEELILRLRSELTVVDGDEMHTS
jgi:hypothetical protein